MAKKATVSATEISMQGVLIVFIILRLQSTKYLNLHTCIQNMLKKARV